MQKVMNILPVMVDSLGIHQKFKSQMVIFYWNKIVGNDIAAQSTPINIEYGILYISVSNSVWSHHLLMMKSDILFKVNHFVGEPMIRDIKFKNCMVSKKELESIEEPEEAIVSLSRNISLDHEENQKVDEQCSLIGDHDLREKIHQVYQQHLKMKKTKIKLNWHKCSKCGSLCPEKELYCHICSIQQKQDKLSEIRRALINVPWATYGEVNQHIVCTPTEYIDAKVTLLNNMMGNIADNDDNSIEVKTLTMLFTGAKYDKVDSRLIQKTMAKFRRKKYVSAFRG